MDLIEGELRCFVVGLERVKAEAELCKDMKIAED